MSISRMILGLVCLVCLGLQKSSHNETDKVDRGGLDKMTLVEIPALENRKKDGKYAKKVKAKTRRKNHEQLNPLEPDGFAHLWKE